MGCVQQAVLEFDQEVRAPWRPRLVPDADATPGLVRHPSRRAPSRVGVCEQPSMPRPVRPRRPTGVAVVPAAERPSGERPPRRRPTAAGRRPSARLRLTQRARRLAVVVALGAGVALGSWLDTMLSDAPDLRLAGESAVVVQSGDTLWSIASSVAGDDDVRAVVDAIQRVNGLSGSELEPGQVLQLP
jgi:nucleoid-associated protein YgaU